MQHNASNRTNRRAIKYENQTELDGLRIRTTILLGDNLTDKLSNVLKLIFIKNYIWQITICNQDHATS